MDALKLLTADHNRVRGLFKRFETAAENDDTATITELAPLIFNELEVHTTIEEELFYPGVRDASDEIRDIVAEAYEEHAVAKHLMQELQAGEPGGETFIAKMKVLIENVEHHAEEEENELFPKVRSALDSGTLEQMAEMAEARKSELGAPTLADKIDLTKEELLEKAREQEIPGRTKMSQEELAATVSP